ncbi:hypothetical protein [uncultured Clostridium sp.]|uniref:hypothetical protein n=1 Tax=uncultured Clostridium sp. TaxID=59620 RepID=UPI0026192A73|nr:hypothetical protein [uncultured Clostridium sp.]
MKKKYLGALILIIMMTSLVGCGNTESKVDSGVSAEQEEKEEKSGDNEVVEKSAQIKENFIQHVEEIGATLNKDLDLKKDNSYKVELDRAKDLFVFPYTDTLNFIDMAFAENSDGDSVFKSFKHYKYADWETEVEWLQETEFKFIESYFPAFFKAVFDLDLDWEKIDEEIKDVDLSDDLYFLEQDGYELSISESRNSLTVMLNIANIEVGTEFEEVYLLESE